jgi:hypothetical protein
MGIDPTGRCDADHLGQEGVVLRDQLFGDATGADDFLTVVNVIEKRVDCTHPLFDPAFQSAPFSGGNHARHDVERDQTFIRLGLTIDIERDAGPAEKRFRLLRFFQQVLGVLSLKPIIKPSIGGAGGSVRVLQFVKKRCFLIHANDVMRLRRGRNANR